MDKRLYQPKYVRNRISKAGTYKQVNNSNATVHSNLGSTEPRPERWRQQAKTKTTNLPSFRSSAHPNTTSVYHLGM